MTDSIQVEKKITRNQTNSSNLSLVVVSLAASLSGPMSCYSFEDNYCDFNTDMYTAMICSENASSENRIKRITEYAEDRYTTSVLQKPNTRQENNELDLKFISLANEFAEKQKDVDLDILNAINKFRQQRATKLPRKKRF